MGKNEFTVSQPFTLNNVKNKILVIKMLKYEDTLIHGEVGKQIYGNAFYKPRISLFPEYSIHRLVLSKFGFTTSDQDVTNYRSIFASYYRSPDDYDVDVLSSVTYMRENKCVYYKQPIINIGHQLPNCQIYELNGTTETSLYEKMGRDFNYTFIAGFSTS
jgi:hypothetical protein